MVIKSKQDIKNLKKSGPIMGEILEHLATLCVPGVTTGEIDRVAEKMIRDAGGRPAFKGYQTHVSFSPFPATVCISINEELVHGIPSDKRVLNDGDIVTLDIGMEWPFKKRPKHMFKDQNISGVFTDTAVTVVVGKASPEIEKLLAVTKQALEEGIKAAQPGGSVADIGKAVETYVKSQGKYGIVRDLVGHGVGHAVHEEPYIPNYYDPALEAVPLKPGMVIAIEPMISLGGWKVTTMDDGWTISMKDKSLCAHFEHTMVITEKGNIVVTRRPGEKSK